MLFIFLNLGSSHICDAGVLYHRGVYSEDIGGCGYSFLVDDRDIVAKGLGVRYVKFTPAAAFSASGFGIAPPVFLTDDHRVLIPLLSNSAKASIPKRRSDCTAPRLSIGSRIPITSSRYFLISFDGIFLMSCVIFRVRYFLKKLSCVSCRGKYNISYQLLLIFLCHSTCHFRNYFRYGVHNCIVILLSWNITAFSSR